MNNYNICIIGDVNCGKTTIASILSSVKFGSIKRRQSTFKYTVLEQTSTDLDCTKTETDDLVTLYTSNKYLGDIPYSVSLYDSISISDEDSCSKFNKLKRMFDVLVIVFDANYGITDNVKSILELSDNTLNIFVVNKYDDLEDEELNENFDDIVTYLMKNNMIKTRNELLKLYALPIYEVMFNRKSKKAENYQSIYKNVNQECGRNALLKEIRDNILINKDKIYNNRLKYLENDSLSLKQIVIMYNECSKYADIVKSLSHYIKKAIDIDSESSCDVDEVNEDNDESDEDESDEESEDEAENEAEDEAENELEEVNDSEVECEVANNEVINDNKKVISVDIFDDVKSVLNFFDDKLKGYIINKYFEANDTVDILKFVKYFGNDDSVCNSFHMEYILSNLLDDIENGCINYDFLEGLSGYLEKVDSLNNESEIREKLDKYLCKMYEYVFDILDSCKSSKSKVLQKYPQYWIGLKMLFDDNNELIKTMKCNICKYYSITSMKSLNAINKCVRELDYVKLSALGTLLNFNV